MPKRLCFCLLMIVLLPPILRSQLTVIVEKAPSYTPVEDSLFLVGSFNDWQPHDPNFHFHSLGEGQWQYDFLTPMPDFEYKITRGSWERVEGGALAEPIPNREYQYNDKLRDTVRIQIEGWEDLKNKLPYTDTILVRITSLPDNTPADASLYIVGTFNGWSPGDPDFRMERDSDGSYYKAIPIRDQLTEYKISRGNWSTVESRANGLARPNRKYEYQAEGTNKVVQIEVANWEDLAGNGINWYSIFLMLAAIQGLLLVVAINSFKEAGNTTSRLLSLLLILLTITFLARIAAFDRDIFQRFPKLLLLPDIIYFTYGPIFWLYLRSLQPHPKERWHWGVHFVPFLIALGIYLPVLSLNNYDFTTSVVNLELRPFFIGSAMMGWLFSAFYWILSRHFLKRLQIGSSPETQAIVNFLWTVFYIHSLCLLVWLSTYLLGLIGFALHQEWTGITDRVTDASWLILAMGAYTMGYYAMRQPQIFRKPELPILNIADAAPEVRPIPSEVETSTPLGSPINIAPQTDGHVLPSQQEISRLEQMMQQQQPHLNPGLSLSMLADEMSLPSHQLSKIINDGFQKNFFDYVNSYRIEAFKQRILEGAHQERTILSLALEAGFNSKTAFNRAFKKHTGQTPREYLRQQKDKVN